MHLQNKRQNVRKCFVMILHENCVANIPVELVIKCEFMSINEKRERTNFYSRVDRTTYLKNKTQTNTYA